MIPLLAKPRLASKARLRLDRVAQRYVLLSPEKGLVMNTTGSAISRLCTGEHSVNSMIDALSREYPGADRARIQTEVLSFLDTLLDRGLIVVDS